MTRWMLPLALAGLFACKTTHERRNPVGETFPTVQGSALDGTAYQIPQDFAGRPVVVLVGYEQDTQFDLDRWLIGLTMAKAPVDIYELPTIPGLIPGMFAGRIDEGMRSGIPKEDWASVITIYDDGDRVAQFTGDENPRPGRVMLLSPTGEVVFFHDRGFSASKLDELIQLL